MRQNLKQVSEDFSKCPTFSYVCLAWFFPWLFTKSLELKRQYWWFFSILISRFGCFCGFSCWAFFTGTPSEVFLKLLVLRPTRKSAKPENSKEGLFDPSQLVGYSREVPGYLLQVVGFFLPISLDTETEKRNRHPLNLHYNSLVVYLHRNASPRKGMWAGDAHAE